MAKIFKIEAAFRIYCNYLGVNPVSPLADNMRETFEAGYLAGGGNSRATAARGLALAMEHLAAESDREAAKSEAEDLLCELLDTLGFSDIVAAYRKVPGL